VKVSLARTRTLPVLAKVRAAFLAALTRSLTLPARLAILTRLLTPLPHRTSVPAPGTLSVSVAVPLRLLTRNQEKALFDTVYIRAAAGTRAFFPELSLPSDFDPAQLDWWSARIKGARLRTLVSRRLAEALKRASGQGAVTAQKPAML
jgi:hypothetical protein